MNTFFFHLHTPDGIEQDDIGVPFASVEEAYIEACRAIPGIAADIIRGRASPLGYSFVIANGNGEEMMTVPFSELEIPRRRTAIRPTPSASVSSQACNDDYIVPRQRVIIRRLQECGHSSASATELLAVLETPLRLQQESKTIAGRSHFTATIRAEQ